MLKSIALLTTTRCDLQCQHCLHGHPMEVHDFPLELLPNLLKDAREFGSQHIGLTGGEPGLHPSFAHLVNIIIEEGYTWSFGSNGQQLDVYLPLAERFSDNLRNVTISLDGANPKTHDTIRCRTGSFNRAISAAKTYVSRGIPLTISTTLNSINYVEIEELVELAQSLGATSIGFGGTIPTDLNHHLTLNDRQRLLLHRQINELLPQADIWYLPRSSLFTQGGINFCSNLTLNSINFNAQGELLFCCDMTENLGVIGSLRTHTLSELIEQWLQIAADLQAHRVKRILSGDMGEGFDTCAFCNTYFREQYGRIGRRQFLAASMISAAGMALAACTPNVTAPPEAVVPTSTYTRKPSSTFTSEPPTLTASQTSKPAATTGTPQPSDTPTDTPEPTATPRYYDHFVEKIRKEDVRVEYSPSVVRIGEKLTATIYFPLEQSGSHGKPFSDIYTVEVEVYTRGSEEFEPGQFTGSRAVIGGENLSGSSEDGFMVVAWFNPTYSANVPYMYIFSIYSVQIGQTNTTAKLARLQADTPIQTIALSGLPNPEDQVIYQDWPTQGPDDSQPDNQPGNSPSDGDPGPTIKPGPGVQG